MLIYYRTFAINLNVMGANEEMKLTPAQNEELRLLEKYGAVYVHGIARHVIYKELIDLGLAEQDGNWYRLKEEPLKEKEKSFNFFRF